MLKKFTKELKMIIFELISEILSYKKEEKIYGIAFVTTDDYYGMYIAFETLENLNRSKRPNTFWFVNEWGYSDSDLSVKFNQELYQNLVDVIEINKEMEFTKPSDEKWEFAMQLMQAIKEAIDSLPQFIFEQNNYSKDDIVFLATMSDGDYMEEMFLESARIFNSPLALTKNNFKMS